jgi:site-specific recombinase XerD
MARSKVVAIQKQCPATWEEALQQFLWWKQAQGVSKRTVDDYKLHVTMFFKRHPAVYREKDCLKKATYEYMGQPIKPATYNMRLIYLRSFFNWCLKEAIVADNPFNELKKRRDEGRVVNIDCDTLKRLLSAPEANTFAGQRDYALLLLTLDTGIRPKEALSLLPDDVNLRSLEVYVRSEVAKTRISRTLPISLITAQKISDLIQGRHRAWSKDTPIFCTTEGQPMTRWTWEQRLKIYSGKIGCKIKPYDLRHAFSLQFLRNGGNALALQRTLGHSSLTMTRRYVALTQEDLKEQHALASPLNVLVPQRHRVRKGV